MPKYSEPEVVEVEEGACIKGTGLECDNCDPDCGNTVEIEEA